MSISQATISLASSFERLDWNRYNFDSFSIFDENSYEKMLRRLLFRIFVNNTNKKRLETSTCFYIKNLNSSKFIRHILDIRCYGYLAILLFGQCLQRNVFAIHREHLEGNFCYQCNILQRERPRKWLIDSRRAAHWYIRRDTCWYTI